MNNFSAVKSFTFTFFILFNVNGFCNAPFLVSAKDSVIKTVAQTATTKSGSTKCGDKAFGKLKFEKAITKYTSALAKGADSLYVIQRIADSYRALGNTTEAEKWYAQIVDHAKASPAVKYNYAEVLRSNKNYAAAQKYYEAYAKTLSNAAPVSAAVSEMDKIPALAKDNGAYKVEALQLNSSKADYAPAFYEEGKLLFTSNRINKKAVYDTWNMNRYSKVYIAALDSTVKTDKVKLKTKCKSYASAATFAKANSELVFTTSSFKKKKTTLQNGKRLPALQLYSAAFENNKGTNATPLAVNGAYSSAQPALSKDGKTLYFASDKLGGYGGTDIYISARNANGVWSEPKNLGAEINSAFDEKFPFIAEDGTLYFSSNAPNGLGGLDVYKTKAENGKWLKPENLGAPVNSNKDEFGLIIDGKNQNGYFASNRDGGMGDDDIYKFTYDEAKLDYKVVVRVEDAATKEPIPMASLSLDCKTTQGAENTLTDKTGEKTFTLKGGKPCTVVAMNDGYKNNSVDISTRNKNTTVAIPLMPDVIKVRIRVIEKENQEPVRDAAISIIAKGNPAVNYSTNEKGLLETTVPVGSYTITSPDFPSLNASFSETSADASGVVSLDFAIPKEEMVVNVPLTANCFTNTVTVVDLKTGERNEVSPNNNGEVRLDLTINNKYVIEHSGKVDTISTVGLKPGMSVEGPCKFYVGQTWVVRNIYYDFNKWNIRADAGSELDNLARIMKQNPSLEIELGSHTDCRATAKYNIVLSARRARSAVEYIAKKGIKSKRILAAGYGEGGITNGCVCEPTNESNCTDPQHQNNRRTEVKVLKY